MCFDTSDADWYCSFAIETTGTSIKPCRCGECGKRIGMWEWRRHIFQREHEECQRCEWEELGPDDEPCVEHDYGEEFTYNRCLDCDKILRAIQAHELRHGCRVSEAQPLLCSLREELQEHHDAALYAAVALEAFPELDSVPWLLEALS